MGRLLTISALSVLALLPGASAMSELNELRALYVRPIPTFIDDKQIALGKKLFFDKRLSGDGSMACATCHDPAHAWGDGLARARGKGGKRLPRRTPTLLGAGWGHSFFWDGRAATLEEQSLKPIASPDEMDLPLPQLLLRLRVDKEYRHAFGGEISLPAVAAALAAFERTIVPGVAPFDRWVGGEEQALSASARRGFVLFNGRAGCVRCHNGWAFTNGSFADTGAPDPDRGRGPIAGSAVLDHAFKTPTLRDLSRRAPYLHDGSLPSLAAVIDRYDQGGAVRRSTTALFLQPLRLSAREKSDLVAFLQSLESESPKESTP